MRKPGDCLSLGWKIVRCNINDGCYRRGFKHVQINTQYESRVNLPLEFTYQRSVRSVKCIADDCSRCSLSTPKVKPEAGAPEQWASRRNLVLHRCKSMLFAPLGPKALLPVAMPVAGESLSSQAGTRNTDQTRAFHTKTLSDRNGCKEGNYALVVIQYHQLVTVESRRLLRRLLLGAIGGAREPLTI